MKDLKKLRTDKGLTQVQVAVKCGVSLAAYRLWEAGASEPNKENYVKLADVLDILPFTGE